MSIVAVLPAHNEAATIAAAISSLRAQTHPPDEVWVVADCCTDDTARIAAAAGARVIDTTGNRDKKAGALNLALPVVLEAGAELILVMDADSTLAPEFIETALRAMADPRVVVGGVFHGDPGGGLVGLLQRNEYCRYARSIFTSNDRACVLTGTATLHRASILREIASARGTTLPGRAGQIYDTAVLTEDNEITLAIKTLGYRCVSPAGCAVLTEVMPTWGDLWNQRLRWQRGALENLRQYGHTRVTRPYLAQQAAMAFGVLALLAYLAVTIWQGVTGRLGLGPLSALGLIFCAERAITVSARGRRHQILAATLVVECAYDLFLQAVLVKSIADIVSGRTARWHHLTGA